MRRKSGKRWCRSVAVPHRCLVARVATGTEPSGYRYLHQEQEPSRYRYFPRLTRAGGLDGTHKHTFLCFRCLLLGQALGHEAKADEILTLLRADFDSA